MKLETLEAKMKRAADRQRNSKYLGVLLIVMVLSQTMSRLQKVHFAPMAVASS